MKEKFNKINDLAYENEFILRPGFTSMGPLIESNNFMVQALKAACQKAGLASPNPTVGCSIESSGKLVSIGVTDKYGGNHAEVNALAHLSQGHSAPLNCYVTLEPCSHYGKRPPCTESLIKSKVDSCEYGVLDPFPEVNGRGVNQLKEAGVEVKLSPFRHECAAWHLPFLFYHRQNRPLVAIKWAQSLNASWADFNGDSKWISGSASRNYTHWLRQKYDAICVGFNTLVKDLPSLDVRLGEKKIRDPLKVFLDPKGNFDQLSPSLQKNIMAKSFSEGKSFYFSPKVGPKHKNIVNVSWTGKIQEVMSYLKSETTIQSILVEGGSRTVSEFITSGYADLYHIFTAPLIFSNGHHNLNLSGYNIPIGSSIKLQALASALLGGDILTEYCSYEVGQLFFSSLK